MANADTDSNTKSESMIKEANKLRERYRTMEEEEEEDDEYLGAWDDVSGSPLDPKEVQRARQEEIDCVHKMNFYPKVPIKDANHRQKFYISEMDRHY